MKPTDADVERTVIQPLYRSTVAEAEAAASASGGAAALRVLVLGEANICRSPLAEALIREELAAAGIADKVVCSSRAVQDFAAGEPVPSHVIEECRRQGLTVTPDHVSRVWRPEWDVVDYDLLVAVDRYVAADAMKEVAVYDAIQKEVEYCSKIRGLYEFGEGNEEIDDPLYGNVGGEAEVQAVRQALAALRRSARGLAGALAAAILRPSEEARAEAGKSEALEEGAATEELRQRLEGMLEGMGAFEWDAPPMLRKRQSETVREMAGDGLLSLEGVL